MNNELSCWELIKQKRFEEACEKADKDYAKSRSQSHLSNKVLALLNLKRYNESLNLSLDLIKINNKKYDSDFLFAGVSYWLLDNHLEAIKIWKEGLNTPYTDAAGGVEIPATLYYAAISMSVSNLEKESIAILKKKWKTKQAQYNFPGTIAGYLLDKIDEQEMIKSLSSQPVLRIREICQAQFYMAVKRLKMGDKTSYYELLKQCSSSETIAYLEQEYYLAVAEIDKKKE